MLIAAALIVATVAMTDSGRPEGVPGAGLSPSVSHPNLPLPCDLQVPPPPLPIRAGDYKRWPRRNFAFIFQTDKGTRIDTFDSLVTKDMVDGPDTTIRLALSNAELDTIYRKVIAIRFFDECKLTGKPFGSRLASLRLVMRAGDVTKELLFAPCYLPCGTDDDFKRVQQLLDLIQAIVGARPEYKALPPTKGAYL